MQLRNNELSKYRQWKGLTQKQLAKELDICIVQLRQIEVGKHLPKYQIRKRICDYFNVSINQIFKEELK